MQGSSAAPPCNFSGWGHHVDKGAEEGFQDENSTPVNLANWPARVRLTPDLLLSRHQLCPQLQAHLDGTACIYVTTCYSGLGTFEMCVKRLAQLASSSGHGSGHDAQDISEKSHACFKLWWACEKGATVREMLLRSACCPQHVFGDIADRVDPLVYKRLEHAVGLLSKRAEEIESSKKSRAEKKKELLALNTRCMQKLLRISLDAVAAGHASDQPRTAYCFVHHKQCVIAPPAGARDLVLEAGGTLAYRFPPKENMPGGCTPRGL